MKTAHFSGHEIHPALMAQRDGLLLVNSINSPETNRFK